MRQLWVWSGPSRKRKRRECSVTYASGSDQTPSENPPSAHGTRSKTTKNDFASHEKRPTESQETGFRWCALATWVRLRFVQKRMCCHSTLKCFSKPKLTI